MIAFALGNSCVFGLVFGVQCTEDAFWHQYGGATANSQEAFLAAASAANRSVEAMSSFPCFTHLNESVI